MSDNTKIYLLNKLKKSQVVTGINKIIFILLCLTGILLINSCEYASGDIGQPPREEQQDAEKEEEGKEKEISTPNEIVVFCGNPGVGKSSLCNSIFQKPIFKSGGCIGKGQTTHKQEFMYNKRLYIDTPGLDDIQQKEQAAEEIEKALKHNDNYKIIFVAMLDSGRIRPADLVTINTVCDAISTDFEYGLIFNKVTKPIIRKIDEVGLEQYLTTLNKKPWTILLLNKDSDMEDEEDVYFPINSENREKLARFIYALKANRIQDRDVNKLDVRDFQERINELEQKYKKEIAELSKKNEEQALKIGTIETQLQQSSLNLRELKVKQEDAVTRENIRGILDIIIQQNYMIDNYLNKSLRERRYDKLKQLRKEICDKLEQAKASLKAMGDINVLEKSFSTASVNLLEKLIKHQIPELERKKKLLDKEYNLWHNTIGYYFGVNTENDREVYLEYTYTPDKDGNFLIHMWAKNTRKMSVSSFDDKRGDFIAQRVLDINAKNNQGLTPLHIATRAKKDCMGIIKCLLKANADPNIYFPNGETVLFSAIMHPTECIAGSIDFTTHLLLQYGANPCMVMLHSGYSRFYKYIASWTALHAAVERQDVGSVKFIVESNKEARQINATVERDGKIEYLRPIDIVSNFYGEKWNGNIEKIMNYLAE